MLKSLFTYILICTAMFGFSQAPSNDSVASPFDFGPLPSPGGCPISNFGATAMANGTLINAKVEVLKPTLMGCQSTTASTTSPNAPDVWYKFEASGDFLRINIKPSGNGLIINKPNLSLFEFQGSILTLLPLECHVGSNDTCNLSFKGITPGKFYYIQVSSDSPTDIGNFQISVENRFQCNDCVQQLELHTYPPPVNGFYEPGQVVKFVYEIKGFKPYQTDALKAIAISLGPGWDTLGTGNSAIASNSVSGNGIWKWSPVVINTQTFAGFKYLSSITPFSSGDGPSDQFDTWTFSWNMRVKPCSPGAQACNMKINNVSEKEYLNLISPCNLDEDFYFKAVPNCCNNMTTGQPLPIFASPPCFSSCNGAITVPAPANPFNSWATLITSNGYIFQDDIFTTTFPLIRDSAKFTSACAGWNNVILPLPSFGCSLLYQDTLQGKDINGYQLNQITAECGKTCNNYATLIIPSMPTGFTATISWFDPANTSTPFYIGTGDSIFCAGKNYSVNIHILNSIGTQICPDITDNIQINNFPKDNAYVQYPSHICTFGSGFTPFVATPGGIFSQVNPLTTPIMDINSGTIFGGAAPDSYTIQYITGGKCPDTSLSYISIDTLFNASFTYPKQEFCKSDPTVAPVINGYIGGNFTFFPSGLVLDTVTGMINPSLSDTGSYTINYFTNSGSPCDNSSNTTLQIKPSCKTHIYNSFSPNGDFLNDYWHIEGIEEKENYVAIYNRWGKKLWDVVDYNNVERKFIGEDNLGFELSEGTYYYIIIFTKEDKTEKNWLEITK